MMISQSRIRRLLSLMFAGVFALAMVSACGGNETEPEADHETSATWITGEEREPVPDATTGQTVIVSMTEHDVAMPTEVAPGPAVFTITNAGNEPHRLRVEGTEVEAELDAPIPPGGTEGLDIILPASGRLQAWCSEPGHRERGEWIEFTVRE